MNLFIFAFLPILGSLAKTIPESISIGAQFPVVEIPDGKIIGTDDFTVGKNTAYHAFKGIPYAQPPLGQLRFAPPVKNSKWTGFWDGTKDASECIQGSGDDIRGTEDCLYLNVYTPSLTRKNLAVMVWFHGGAFTGGDSKYQSNGPDFFLEEDVVFVSLNYRLGIFGFFSTEDQLAPGNWGLKDQVLALKWVKDNIQHFGGDPNRITIFGESAGGASVSYLLQIPKAQGLFTNAIMQSGTSETLWALSNRARSAAFQVGRGLGIITLLSRTLVDRLRNIDAYRVQAEAGGAFSSIYILNPLRGLIFAPVIEVDNPNAVFTQKSDDYFRSGGYPSRVPTIIGYTSNEGGHADGMAAAFSTYLLLFDVISNTLTPYSLTSTSQLRNLAANDIRLFFFGVNSIRSQFDQVVKFINTDQFNRGSRRVAENVAKFAPTYFYVFGYEGQVINSTYPGVGHAEDLAYMFRFDSLVYSAKDIEVRSKLIRMWTNFAKTSNPTPTRERLLDNVIWRPINSASGDVDFLWLNGTLSLDKNPDQEAYKFYESVFDQFGDQSYSTF